MSRSALRALVRYGLKPFLQPYMPLALQRGYVRVAATINRMPAGVAADNVELDSVVARQLTPGSAVPGTALLYLHGGAFVVGSMASHGALAANLAQASGTSTYIIDYRLAPEHPYPAALDDATVAFESLVAGGARVAVAGDSAGAGLALALALRLRDAGRRLPAALALISPFADLTLSGASMSERAARDPMLTRAWLDWASALYAGPVSRDRVSLLSADLRGLPPMLIHVGSEEVLYSDAERLAQRAVEQGVSARLRVYEGLWHEFHVHAPLLPEANAAIAELGEFLREHMTA